MQNALARESVLKNVLRFSLPYLLSYFLQTLYGMADLLIIGHAVGAGENRRAGSTIGNGAVLFLVFSAALLAGLVGPITAIMSTPAEAVAGTRAYLTICFIGIPCITAYNIIAAIYRGLGDSKSPMYFIAVACAANIVLDLVFMGALGMGPVGAALGTTLSQAISVVVSLAAILKRRPPRPCIGYAAVRHRHYAGLWCGGGRAGAVHRAECRGAVHRRRRRHCGGCVVSARVYFRLLLCGGAFQFQRVFLRLWPQRTVVHP